jgi:hypothetical protein
MNKFEKLIEYVINDEDSKASDLFHEIVVEKSRDIYEGLMNREFPPQDETSDLIDDVESDEQFAEADDDEMDMGDEMIAGDDMEAGDEMDMEIDAEGGEEIEGEELEDRVVDLENQLDELMAEFETLMTDGEHEEAHDTDFDDSGEIGDEEEMPMEGADCDDDKIDEDAEALEEALTLQNAPKPETSEDGNVNKKSINNDNSGSDGSEAKPHQTTGEEKGRTAPDAKDMGYTPTQEAGKKAFKSNAPKPKTGEESGTNDKSLVK